MPDQVERVMTEEQEPEEKKDDTAAEDKKIYAAWIYGYEEKMEAVICGPKQCPGAEYLWQTNHPIKAGESYLMSYRVWGESEVKTVRCNVQGENCILTFETDEQEMRKWLIDQERL